MSDVLEERVARLEKRVERLEYRGGKILALTDSRKDPLARYVLDSDLNHEQVMGICQVMESTHTAVVAGQPPSRAEFERQLSLHVPEQERIRMYSFVQGLLGTFAQTGQWDAVVDHFREDFNVRTPNRRVDQ